MSGFTFLDPGRTGIDAVRDVGEITVALRAEKLRQERTGLHAHVTFIVGTVKLHADNFNIDKDDQRHDFANKLYGTARAPGKLGDPIKALYDQATFEHELLLWSEAVWLAWVGQDEGEARGGNLEPSEITQVVKGYIVEGGGTALYSPPKVAKTFSALLWLVSVDAGVQTFWKVQQRKVMLVNLERDAASLDRRLGAVNRILGLEPDRPLLRMDKRGRSLADVYDAAQRTVDRHRVELVGLDSLTRGGFGNLNGNEEATKSMDMLNALCPTWCAIGHTPYGDDSKLFGSQMFRAAYDVGVNLKAGYGVDQYGREDRLRKAVKFVVADANDLMPAPDRTLVYEFDQRLGLMGVREPFPDEAFPDLEDASDSRDDLVRVLDHYSAYGPCSQSQVASDLSLKKQRVSELTAILISRGQVIRTGTGASTSKGGRPTDLYDSARNREQAR